MFDLQLPTTGARSCIRTRIDLFGISILLEEIKNTSTQDTQFTPLCGFDFTVTIVNIKTFINIIDI